MDIVIVDQRATHERVCYEKLKRQIKDDNIQSQRLFVLEIIELDNLDIQGKLLNLKDSLLRSGLKIEYHSKNSIKVIEISYLLGQCNIKELIAKIINNVLDLEDGVNINLFINKVLAAHICYFSIGDGHQMLIREMEQGSWGV